MKNLVIVAVLFGLTFTIGCGNDSTSNVESKTPQVPQIVELPETLSSEHVKTAEDMYKLGLRYYKGDGVKTNVQEAVIWYRKAAEQGHLRAQSDLALCCINGIGLEKNVDEAIKWFRKSAEQGFADAQFFLGISYEAGNGVNKDMKEALKWYRKAAEQGFARAQFVLSLCYANGNGIVQDLQESFKWLQKSADQGFADAQCNMGVFYVNGYGCEKNVEEALKWFQKATENGNVYAQKHLAERYAHGDGVEKDIPKALKWYRKAAARGDVGAQFLLAVYFVNGEGVEKNVQEAVKWYRKAAKGGHKHAQYWLGVCYANGEGIERNQKEAAAWICKAAEQGLADAQYRAARFYETGDGVEKNMEEAKKWYGKAAEQGHQKAQAFFANYCVIDLSGGPDAEKYPVALLKDAPAEGWSEEYKTKKLVLRKIPAGKFMMGSLENEVGRDEFTYFEKQHEVTIPSGFWIGVFEVTQKQWSLVMDSKPSENWLIEEATDAHPVENMNYMDICGYPEIKEEDGWSLPSGAAEVKEKSFMTKLQKKTGLNVCLPTDEQWEYACRAETNTALNNGKNLQSEEKDSAMNEVGRYKGNSGRYESHRIVGSYKPNKWGLYDMHGNVCEWCKNTYDERDKWDKRVVRGGGWDSLAKRCRSASFAARDFMSGNENNTGFRVACFDD